MEMNQKKSKKKQESTKQNIKKSKGGPTHDPEKAGG